jgi:hypothetical protein
MGDRRNIRLQYDGDEKQVIYFYTHWGASTMLEELQQALKKGEDRWNDDSYLARIIFSELVKNDIDGNTGFGIAPYEIDPENPTIEVDLQEQTVNGIPFKDFVNIEHFIS